MKKIFRPFVGFLLLTLLGTTVLWTWLQWAYLPGPGKRLLSQKLEDALGMPIEIGRLALNAAGTLAFQDIQVFADEARSAPLASADDISFKVKLSDLLIRKQVMLSSIQTTRLSFYGNAQGVQADLTVQGAVRVPLDADETWNVEGLIFVTAGKVTGLPGIGAIEELSGNLFFDEKRITLRAKVQGAWHDFSADLQDRDAPLIRWKLASENLALASEMHILPSAIDILKIEGHYQNIPFSATGTVPSLKSPSLNLRSAFELDLEQLAELLRKNNFLSRHRLTGVIRVTSSLNLTRAGLKNIRAQLNAESTEIRMNRYILNDLSILMSIDEGLLTVEDLRAQIYDGTLRGIGEIGLFAGHPSYRGRINVYKAGLRGLLPEKTVAAKKISGYISGEAYFYGLAGDSKTLKGKGRLLLSEGQVWEVPILKGLGNVLKLPGLKSIPIYGARGDFSIKDRWVTTDNLILESSRYQIGVTGGIAFDKSLDFHVQTRVAPDREGSSKGLGILSNAFLEYSDIDIHGTLDKPDYDVKFLHPERIFWNTLQKNILGPILDTLGNR